MKKVGERKLITWLWFCHALRCRVGWDRWSSQMSGHHTSLRLPTSRRVATMAVTANPSAIHVRMVDLGRPVRLTASAMLTNRPALVELMCWCWARW